MKPQLMAKEGLFLDGEDGDQNDKAAGNEAKRKRRLARAQRLELSEEVEEEWMYQCPHCPGCKAVSEDDLQTHLAQFHPAFGANDASSKVLDGVIESLKCSICPDFKGPNLMAVQHHMKR